MKKPRATAVACVALTLGGLTTGCDLDFLKEIVRDGLVTGLEAEAAKIPELILDAIFGSDDAEDD